MTCQAFEEGHFSAGVLNMIEVKPFELQKVVDTSSDDKVCNRAIYASSWVGKSMKLLALLQRCHEGWNPMQDSTANPIQEDFTPRDELIETQGKGTAWVKDEMDLSFVDEIRHRSVFFMTNTPTMLESLPGNETVRQTGFALDGDGNRGAVDEPASAPKKATRMGRPAK